MTVKILVVSRIYTPESGAAAFRLAAAVKSLRESGNDVTVLTTRLRGHSEADRTIRRWPVLRDRGGAVRGYMQYASFDIPLFFRMLFTPRFDVILVEPPPTTGIVARVIGMIRQKPYIYYSADVSSAAARGIGVSAVVVRTLMFMEKWVLNGASAILSVSPGVTQAIKELTGSCGTVHDVGTGIDTDVFTAVGPRAPEWHKTFVYAGTMSEIQGAGVFVEAFLQICGRYPDIKLIMYGQGVEADSLRTRAMPAGDQIEFRGTVDGQTVAASLRSAVAGLASVRPARGYDFAFATKALATLGCGTPVLYAGPGPMRDLIDEHDLGISVAWDVDAVAGAMEAFLNGAHGGADPERLASWVLENNSLRSVGERAAAVIGAVT